MRINTQAIKIASKCVLTFLAKNAPTILTGIGIGGMVTSTVLAVKATPKACRIIDKVEDDRIKQAEADGLDVNDIDTSLTFKDKVKATWKCYAPAAGITLLSAGCIIFSDGIATSRTAMFATAYQLSEAALQEYHERVVEEIGPKKEQEIQDRIIADHVDKRPVVDENIALTHNGETLFFDDFCGRYFRSDIEKVRKVANDLDYQLNKEGYVSLNDFYDGVGIEPTGSGDDMGWKSTDCKTLIADSIRFGSKIASNGEPAITLKFKVFPYYGYDKWSN